MSYQPRYDKGDWKAICDSCGKEFKASSLRKRWDGLMVCPIDWETRHPQDFVRGILDIQVPPWTRPESSGIGGDSFVHVCTPLSIGGGADFATADCARADGTVTSDQFTQYFPPDSYTSYNNGYSMGRINNNCTQIIPNSTKDFGVVQYSGPFESLQSVPITTIVNSIVASDPCGNSLQKTVTKTYSSRSVANQWKAAATWVAYPSASQVVTPAPWSNFVYSSVSSADALALIIADSNANCPFPTTDFPTVVAVPNTASCSVYGAISGLQISFNVTLGGTWSFYAAGAGYGSYANSQLTLYYLDVHEVWTYSVIGSI